MAPNGNPGNPFGKDDRPLPPTSGGQQGAGAQQRGPAPGTAGPTQGGSSGGGSDFLVQPPAVSIPKGGGAIQGIGEKFQANPVTGTGSMSVPIAVSPGRGGVQPNLALSYDSGGGNSPFGLGWRVGIASIRRKTDRGLPRYLDADDSDIFVFSEAEDLIPLLEPSGDQWVEPTLADVPQGGTTYRRRRYRPRVEGAFARIERWTDVATGDRHWRTTSASNVTRIYGLDSTARVVDPDQPNHVFEWLLERSEDELGNVIHYEYKTDDARDGVGLPIHDVARQRIGHKCTYRHIKRIRYGNQVADPDPATDAHWAFMVVFDYGEHDLAAPTAIEPDPTTWGVRLDPFSTYRSGFDIRCHRLCRRVMMFHRFAELGTGDWTLVRSTELEHDPSPVATTLTSVTQRGWVNDGSWVTQTMPPVEFQYTQAEIDTSVHHVEGMEDLPGGLDMRRMQWVDLDGEGLQGLLTEQVGEWWYKRNEGNGRLGALRRLPTKPSIPLGQARLMDIGGDGRIDLVRTGPPQAGYRRHNEDGSWEPFRPFKHTPNINFNDPNLRYIDLTGDGQADLLISQDILFRWYPSLAEEGFGPAERTFKGRDDNEGPTLVFASNDESIFLADMSGDGLTDLVRIRNGYVCYWPNRGYGRFGGKITMAHAPRFDRVDAFDPARIRLADIDGSGPTDLLYFSSAGVRMWANQSGNGFGVVVELSGFPRIDNSTVLQVMDLQGTGTASVVWSSQLPGQRWSPLRFVNLMAQGKPHLLTKVINNLGRETELSYKPSTQYYLEDRQAGTPWATRLSFPVHCLERVTVTDGITGWTFSNRYAYHHGYFDGPEREFRGFGMVEQWDTETLPDYEDIDPDPDQLLHYVPPVHTKTWFHTGAWLQGTTLEAAYAAEYFIGDGGAFHLPETLFTVAMTPQDAREAFRACKGQILRSEVYADDDSAGAERPYTVSEGSFQVRQLQPRVGNAHGSFLRIPAESATWHYERDPDHPRTTHTLTLEANEYGQILLSAAASYAYRGLGGVYPEQNVSHIVIAQNAVINDVLSDDHYHLGVPAQQKSWQLTGYTWNGHEQLFAADLPADLAAFDAVSEVPFEDDPTTGLQKRCLGEVRTIYYDPDLTPTPGPVALGTMGAVALVHQRYQRVFTDGLVTDAFDGNVTSTMLQDEGGYVRRSDATGDDQLWWMPSGTQSYDSTKFYLPTSVSDPFGNTTTVTWDSYCLMTTEVTDAVGNSVEADIDYRLLAPWQVTDPNEQIAQAAFDALGRVVKTAIIGRDGEGDTLTDPTTEITYELTRWINDSLPNRVHTRARETHADPGSRWQESYAYSDGGGNVVSTKVQAEPGLAYDVGTSQWVHTDPRWVGSGRTVVDNKGNPVKQFEPFFSMTEEYEDDVELVEWGVTPVLYYDPLGRNIRTDLPNGTFRTVEFEPWKQITADENDNVENTDWYDDRMDLDPGDPEYKAAVKAFAHRGTPTLTHLDAMGRVFLTRADNGSESTHDYYDTRLALDVQGNPLMVTDAMLKDVQTQTFDMIGRPLFTNSVDAGGTRGLADVASQPIRTWKSEDLAIRQQYDELRRPSHLWVHEGVDPERLEQRSIYGESLSHAAALAANLIGRPYRTYDGAGVQSTGSYDFKGTPLSGTRRMLLEVDAQVDWTALATLSDATAIETAAESSLRTETFTTSMTYDALSRVITQTTPDASITRYTFNEAGLLETVDVDIRGAGSFTSFVEGIAYNAKGQRESIVYGNGTSTSYEYDPDTFRLTGLVTTRSSDGAKLQDLSYHYDPVGNITQITDDAQDTLYFDNAEIEPTGTYTYDPIYRLSEATGRERGDSVVGVLGPDDSAHGVVPDTTAVRGYTETYTYDKVGNIEQMHHVATGLHGETWNRDYEYVTGSNRLDRTTASGTGGGWATYTHDDRGNMTVMPHLSAIVPNFRDQIRSVTINGGGDNDVYHYDASGQRVRKVQRRGSWTRERLYIGGYEIYREFDGVNPDPELERETLHVSDDARRISMVETLTIDGGTPVGTPNPLQRYQLDNHLGTCCVETDEVGAVITFEEFHPYGTTAWRARKSGIEVSEKRYRYTGKEKDEGTGFYYHGARFYACWVGRWSSSDPADIQGGAGGYVYVNSNPIVLRDPDGKKPAWSINLSGSISLGDWKVSASLNITSLGTRLSGEISKANSSNVIPLFPEEDIPPPDPALYQLEREMDKSGGVGPTMAPLQQAAWQEFQDPTNPRVARSTAFTLSYLSTGAVALDELIYRPIRNIPYHARIGGEYLALATQSENPEQRFHFGWKAAENLTIAAFGLSAVAAPFKGLLQSSMKRLAGGGGIASKAGPKLLTNRGTGRFAGDQAVVHFERHGGEVMSALGRDAYGIKDYLADAQHVIDTGTWVPEMSGFTKIIGGPGSAKTAFVGLNRTTGDITTFHIKSVKEMAKKAPSLGWEK